MRGRGFDPRTSECSVQETNQLGLEPHTERKLSALNGPTRTSQHGPTWTHLHASNQNPSSVWILAVHSTRVRSVFSGGLLLSRISQACLANTGDGATMSLLRVRGKLFRTTLWTYPAAARSNPSRKSIIDARRWDSNSCFPHWKLAR